MQTAIKKFIPCCPKNSVLPFYLEDIKSINFRKEMLYKNNKELELNNEKEEVDIVDDMFD